MKYFKQISPVKLSATLDIEARKTTFVIGEPIRLSATVSNCGASPLFLEIRQDEIDVAPEVQLDGQAVARTRIGHALWVNADAGRCYGMTVEAGNSHFARLRINSLFDMTRPGKYQVRVSRWVTRQGDFVELQTPWLQVEIRDACT